MSQAQAAKAPVHLWIVGVVALLWNLMGAFDYVMTETRNEAYMEKFTPEQLEFFYGFPAWVIAFWAIAVWGGVLGAILLLMRKKLTVPVLLISFLSMVVVSVHNYGFSGCADIVGATGVIMSVVIFVIALGLFIYASNMAKKGVLA